MNWIEEKLKALKAMAMSCRKENDKTGASAYLCLIGDIETQLKRGAMDQPAFYSMVTKHVNGILECSERREIMTPEEEYQLNLLSDLLPSKMTEEEIIHEAKVIIGEVGASTPRDMGKVMAAFKGKFPGRYDGESLSKIVKSYLK